MMLLFILESIGTTELLLIGIIALIFLGPRKLPQMAKTIGKTMAEFRRTTTEFKSTWEREVDFENLDDDEPAKETPAPVARVTSIGSAEPVIAPPEIRELDEESARKILPQRGESSETQPSTESDKKSWL